MALDASRNGAESLVDSKGCCNMIARNGLVIESERRPEESVGVGDRLVKVMGVNGNIAKQLEHREY